MLLPRPRLVSRLTGLAGCGLAIVGLLAISTPAFAVSSASSTSASSPGGYAIGDSVMQGARHELMARGIRAVNAIKSRQASAGPSLLRARRARLPRNVVIHLGTNGTYPLAVCLEMVDAIGPGHHVFLVTIHVPRRWQDADNAVIRRCAAAYPDGHVHVVDWHAAAHAHPAWLYTDRTHLRPSGAKGFAELIAAEIAATRG